jgi:hypothetical protein
LGKKVTSLDYVDDINLANLLLPFTKVYQTYK